MTISATSEIHLENLARLQTAIHIGMLEGLDNAGKLIVDLASQLAPKDSGELSLSGKSSMNGDVLTVTFGESIADLRAVAQEYGTIYMPAQPYLSVAVANIDIVEEIAKVVRSKL